MEVIDSLTLIFQIIGVAYDPVTDMAFWSMNQRGGIYKKPLRSPGVATYIINTGNLSLSFSIVLFLVSGILDA